MKLDYLQFLELEVFTRFGSQLEASMEAKIRRGRALRELFRQERLAPQAIEFQLAWMTAYNEGMLESFSPAALSECVRRIGERVARGVLTLDTGREKWVEALAGWIEEGAAP